MGYSIEYHKKVEKDLHRLSHQARDYFFTSICDILEREPKCGKPMQGPYAHLRSYGFQYKGTSYRVVYELLHDELVLYVIIVDKREDVYKRLKRRI